MRRPSTLTLAVLILVSGCGEASPELDRTDPGAVVRAWVHALSRGDGSHQDLEFKEVPPGHPSAKQTSHHLPPGGAVEAIGELDFGITGTGTRPDPGDGFHLRAYALKTGQSSGVTADGVTSLSVNFEVTLADGSKPPRWQVALRPEGSFGKPVRVDEDTRWFVVP